MASTRLPGKPLAKIEDKSMIAHVVDRAREAGIGEPVVATDSLKILEAVEGEGARAIMTREDHASGSDRIFEALTKIDPHGDIEYIINLQGDLPTLAPGLLSKCLDLVRTGSAHIGTLACEISDEAERIDPNVVKVVGTPIGPNQLNALYFTRATAPHGNEGPHYHHIGLYAYTRSSLERFVSLPPGVLEIRERLEQLRALENGMRIHVELVDANPLGVDTPEDLEQARMALERK